MQNPEVLEALDEAAIRSAARGAVAASLQIASEEAKAACPKETGALAASIGCRVSESGGELFASAPYAMPVEMGTAHMPARPFLYPAFAAHRQRLPGRIAQAIKDAVRSGSRRG